MRKLLPFVILLIPVIALAQELTEATAINITKSWSQEPSGFTYPISVKVPRGTVPQNGFPVCILLHGNGGNGIGMINQFRNVLECHALVAPTGYQNSWNICGENSDAPDVDMVNDLVELLQDYTNINPHKIRIIGSSNGAGLANNIFIENTNAGIDIVCAIVSQLNVPQYHSDGFYYPSADTDASSSYCGYDVLANPLATRKYLSISNINDPIIPYSGGTSVVGVDFLAAEMAAYKIALHQGYTGSQLTSGISMGSPEITAYSYLSGKVVHIKGDAGHSANLTQRNYIKDFFSDCAVVVGAYEDKLDEFEVYPNPASTMISVEGVADKGAQYSILNVQGQQVLSGASTLKNFYIDLSELPSHVYFLRINQRIVKIIKAN